MQVLTVKLLLLSALFVLLAITVNKESQHQLFAQQIFIASKEVQLSHCVLQVICVWKVQQRQKFVKQVSTVIKVNINA